MPGIFQTYGSIISIAFIVGIAVMLIGILNEFYFIEEISVGYVPLISIMITFLFAATMNVRKSMTKPLLFEK